MYQGLHSGVRLALLSICVAASPLGLRADRDIPFLASLLDSVSYSAEASMTVSTGGKFTPFWLTSNRYGMSGARTDNGHMAVGVFRDISADSARLWKVGYGVELAAAHHYTSDVFLQQYYLDLGYRKVRLSAGAKERPAAFKDAELSTGSQTLGINARPIPEFRFEVPDYISISGRRKIVSVRGHFGYGLLSDNHWVSSRARRADLQYVQHVLYHSKAGYMRIGNPEHFPLTLEGGLEMAVTFGGRLRRNDGFNTSLYGGLADFFDVVFGVGHDKGQTDYKNSKGNTVGSWLLNLTYYGHGWQARAYYDHFFEDHSGLLYKYGDYDGLYGIEVTLPRNRVVSKVVGEYIYTRFQSGAMYHDHTALFPRNIAGLDDYYNHSLYAGWQHWGMAIGNPLFLSPVYNSDNNLYFRSNRFSAQHIALSGDPSSSLHYRLLYTVSRQWGTYFYPYDDVRYQRSMLGEITFSPRRLFGLDTRGWSGVCAFAFDYGSHTGNNSGFQIAIRKQGLLLPKR